MQNGVPTKTIAAILALAGFCIAVLSGLAAGNATSRTLGVALVSMLVCHIVGLAIGAAGEYVVAEHARAYRDANPIPDSRRASLSTNQPGTHD